jgi:hypothetical protein
MQEAGCRMRDAGGRRQEAGGRRQEAGGRRQEAGGRRQEAGGRISLGLGSVLVVQLARLHLHVGVLLRDRLVLARHLRQRFMEQAVSA